jgi:DNA-binding MarR family transcriptional regulator
MVQTKHRHVRPAYPDILRIIALLPRVASSINEWQRRQVSEGFTVNQALMLHHLVSHGDASPSEIADWMRVTRGSVTPVVKRLEDLGLLTRRVDKHDGRRQWLSATTRAREIAESVEKQALRPVLKGFGQWSAAELKQFSAGLQRLLTIETFGGRA